MKKIGKMVHHIEDEMKSAKCYAELFIKNKADGNIELANQFRNMAQAEIDHTNFWHQLSVTLIEKVKKVYKPSAEKLLRYSRDKAYGIWFMVYGQGK